MDHIGGQSSIPQTSLSISLKGYGLGKSLVEVPNVGDGSIDVRKAIDEQLQKLMKRTVAIVETDRALALLLADRLVAEKLLSGAEMAKVLVEWSVLPRKGQRTEHEEGSLWPGDLRRR